MTLKVNIMFVCNFVFMEKFIDYQKILSDFMEMRWNFETLLNFNNISMKAANFWDGCKAKNKKVLVSDYPTGDRVS